MTNYTPRRVGGGGFTGEKGIAKVRLNKKKSLVQVLFKDSKKPIRLRSKNCPKKTRAGVWYVTLNKNEDEMLNFRPVNGMFVGKVSSYVAREGEKPAPQTKVVDFVNDEGKRVKYDYLYFLVILNILEPKEFKGMTVPHMLRYNYVEAEEDNKPVVGYMSKGKWTENLIEFDNSVGVWDRGAMRWKDNILPGLEKRVLRANKKFQFVLKNGYVNTLFAIDEPEEEIESMDNDLPWSEDEE